MKTFEELGLSKEVLQVVRKLGFKEPSQIQEQAIPLALAGKDIIGGSATGSGKTLAFASPIIEKIKPNGHIQALILTPTRELAEQVAKSIREFSQYKNLNVLAVYGGVDIVTQTRKLARTDIVVATPGRVLDHLKRRTIRLDYVKFLVLDEVDRMFDMGFHRDVETILRECPKERQTMLFSATISSDLDHLAQKHTKKVFIPFKRLQPREESWGGSGIGLAIAKKIIEKHQSVIWLESQKDKGTTVFFKLEGINHDP